MPIVTARNPLVIQPYGESSQAHGPFLSGYHRRGLHFHKMNLWTYHAPDFSLTSGRIDHTLSPYADDPAIMAAYRELGLRLNVPDVQIIWCYTRHGRFPLTGILHREWHLSVPLDKVRACYNQVVWNRIIGRPSASTARMQRTPVEDLWSQLLVPIQDGEAISAIILHPVPENWIVSTTLVSVELDSARRAERAHKRLRR
jgi:hypothetical protein